MKEVLHEIPIYQEFAHLDEGIMRLPDESTILRFRHLMPYLLAEWFGHQISIEIIKSVKANRQLDVWLFVVKKLMEGKLSV